MPRTNKAKAHYSPIHTTPSMVQYTEGDVVLLSNSKLGIMTSTTTVREIRGNNTEISSIIRKLSVQELAERVVALVESYKVLSSKQSRTTNTKQTKPSNKNCTTNSVSTEITTATTASTKHKIGRNGIDILLDTNTNNNGYIDNNSTK